MGHREILPGVGHSRGVLADEIAEERVLPGFVERDPMLDTIAKRADDHVNILSKPGRCLAASKAAILFEERLGHVPMIERNKGGDVLCQQGIDQAVVVIETFSVDRALALRAHATPGDREAIRIHFQLGHDRHIGLEVVVGVAGNITRVSILDLPGLAHKHIPDRGAFAIGIPAAFNLVGGGGGAEGETVGELRVAVHTRSHSIRLIDQG